MTMEASTVEGKKKTAVSYNKSMLTVTESVLGVILGKFLQFLHEIC